MGTRNLTMVVHEGKIKLAHYCQWDGYFDSAGEKILEFLKTDFKPEVFVQNLAKVEAISATELEKQWKELGGVADLVKEKHFNWSRDCSGAEALKMVQDGKMTVQYLNTTFAYDSLFCEFLYLLDMDRYVWEIYVGFNKDKLPKKARFYKDKPNEDGYYAVRLFAEIPFDKLPTDLKKLEKKLEKEKGE